MLTLFYFSNLSYSPYKWACIITAIFFSDDKIIIKAYSSTISLTSALLDIHYISRSDLP